MPATLAIGALDLDDSLVARLAAFRSVIVWRPPGSRHSAPPSASVDIAATVAAACTAPIVISAFPDDTALTSIAGAADGVLASLSEGTLHVAAGLHSRTAIDDICREHQRRGQRFVAAPILLTAGASQPAAAILGGAAEAVAQARSVFEAIGISIAGVCDKPADAAILATAHAAMLASAMEAIAEAFALVRKYGVDPVVMREVMSDALFAGSVYPLLADEMLGRSEGNGPSAAGGMRIVDLALDAADAAHVPLAGVDACRDRLLSAIARGAGERSWTVVAAEQARASGLE